MSDRQTASPIALTALQREALAHIDAGAVTMRSHGIGAWRINGPCQPVVVGRVISLGLAAWVDGPGRKVARLTEAGRRATSQAPLNSLKGPADQ